MADYKELLRRAISALPENNGAARRAVYEKARSALVGQLRAINPPLPARDITQHRLQLEDCIRQVEQEASEANITFGRDIVPPRPAPAAAAIVQPEIAEPVIVAPVTQPAGSGAAFARATLQPVTPVAAPGPNPGAQTAIEDIIAAAESDNPRQDAPTPEPEAVEPKPEPIRPDQRSIASMISRAEANRNGPVAPVPNSIATAFERREPSPGLAASAKIEPIRSGGLRREPALGSAALALQRSLEPASVPQSLPALSAVREVEVEPVVAPGPIEAEGVIERAIETLDREARGEKTAMLPDTPDAQTLGLDRDKAAALDEERDEAPASRRGAGLTIFLAVFVVLLLGVGGAGFWAWNQGYIKLDQMFGSSSAAVADAQPPRSTAPATPTLDSATDTAPAAQATGPGNTASSSASTDATSTLDGLEPVERLAATPATSLPSANSVSAPGTTPAVAPEAATTTGNERLPEETSAQVAASDPAASVDPAVLAGSQSLLLEATTDGKTGAVPFSGTVDWSQGVDEIGLPTLVGKANIPARNLSLDLIIRKNADSSLPASHLMEVNFTVSDSFIGGTIAGLPGVLLKNEELVQGTPLVGASARVVGSSFLFALSASDQDVTANTDLLTSRKWIDFAVIYGTGTRAIVTLEKDDTAQALFAKVFSAWAAAK